MSGGYVNAAFAESAGDPSVFHTIELGERRERTNRVAPADEPCDKHDQSSSGAGSPAGDGMQTIPLGGCKLETKPDPRFGWSVLKPACLQRFRTAKWALFWLCWAGALQGMVVNGFVNVVITTIERRFGLRSSQTGLIAGGYDIASFLCLVPVTYLGGRAAASKPRWFGWGVLVMGAGSLVFALPHFAVGLYRGASDDVDICQRDGGNGTENPTTCSAAAGGDTPLAVWAFLAAQLLHGAGAAPLFTLGVTYIDENVSKKMSSVYLGIYYTMAVIGPALGYVVGGQLLTLYTDFASVDPAQVGMTPASTVWVGAWWVGFLLAAALCVVLAVPLLGFPPSLPGAEELQKERVSEAHDGDASRSEAFGKIRELPKAFLVLMKNPTFVFLNLAGSSEGMLISGFAAFLPKLMENQFTVNASTAALLLGVITVPAGGGGTFLGGYLVKKWNLNCAGIIKLCVIATLVATAFTLCFFLSCPNLAFAGITQAYGENITENVNPPALDSVCNTGCACAHVEYAPVCGADGVTYFSPCHAGCAQRILMLDNMQLYADCACIAMPPNRSLPAVDVAMNDIEISTEMFTDKRGGDGNSTFGAVSNKGSRISVPYEAINRSCQSDCPYLWIFVALAFGIMFFTFLATMPALSATLRCVRDDQRSFALGIQWIKVRLLGTIPAPMIFGFLIDETCILWQTSCDGPGACLVYDNLNMSRYMLALAFIGKFCSLLFFFLAWWFYKPPQQAKIDDHQLTSSDVKLQSNGTNGYLNGAVDHNERY